MGMQRQILQTAFLWVSLSLGFVLLPCVSEANDARITVTWPSNTDNITGYRLYKDGVQVAVVPQSVSPAIVLSARTDLGLTDGTHTACFTLEAYRDTGGLIEVSDPTLPGCTTSFFLNPLPQTPGALNITVEIVP